MEALIKGAQGTLRVPIDAANLDDRKIFLEGAIDSKSADLFIRQLLHLASRDDSRIDVLINSPGGSVSAGLLIVDAIQSCGMPVRTICLEKAYSMAAIILASGTAGRGILPHSQVMLHRPWIDARLQANQSDILSIAQSMEAQEKQVLEVLTQSTGKEAGELKEAMNYDHFFTAREAREFGLVDSIITLKEIMED